MLWWMSTMKLKGTLQMFNSGVQLSYKGLNHIDINIAAAKVYAIYHIPKTG